MPDILKKSTTKPYRRNCISSRSYKYNTASPAATPLPTTASKTDRSQCDDVEQIRMIAVKALILIGAVGAISQGFQEGFGAHRHAHEGLLRLNDITFRHLGG